MVLGNKKNLNDSIRMKIHRQKVKWFGSLDLIVSLKFFYRYSDINATIIITNIIIYIHLISQL